jgi:beta-lactamase regulating signal transducer with metallopeptidase domain
MISTMAGVWRMIGDALALRKLRREARPVSLRGGSDAAPVLVSAARIGPLTCGLVRPVILLPEFLFRAESGAALDMTLAHERGHLARHDHWWLALTELALIPLALHPASRWLRQELSTARELACDERVLNDGRNAGEYARALLSVAGSIRKAAPARALGAASGAALSIRIGAILLHVECGAAARRRRTPLLACLMAAALFAGTFVAAAHTFSAWNPLPVLHHVHDGPKPPPPPVRR